MLQKPHKKHPFSDYILSSNNLNEEDYYYCLDDWKEKPEKVFHFSLQKIVHVENLEKKNKHYGRIYTK